MRSNSWKIVCAIILGSFLAACQAASTSPASTAAETQPAPTTAMTVSPSATQTPQATPTEWPPVFDPNTVGDIHELDSLIFSQTYRTLSGCHPDCINTDETLGYIKEPRTIYVTYTSSFNSINFSNYLIDGVLYEMFTRSYGPGYMLSPHPNKDLIEIKFPNFFYQGTSFADSFGIPSATATFAQQEIYEGIPVNQFTFGMSDINWPGGGTTLLDANGEFYLTQDGNHPVYLHWVHTEQYLDDVYTVEITEKLTSINQPLDIHLPGDFPQLAMDPGLPLPEGAYLDNIESPCYLQISGCISYAYAVNVSEDAVKEFYQGLGAVYPEEGATDYGKLLMDGMNFDIVVERIGVGSSCFDASKGTMCLIITTH